MTRLRFKEQKKNRKKIELVVSLQKNIFLNGKTSERRRANKKLNHFWEERERERNDFFSKASII